MTWCAAGGCGCVDPRKVSEGSLKKKMKRKTEGGGGVQLPIVLYDDDDCTSAIGG
jgi:hypothetical protein